MSGSIWSKVNGILIPAQLIAEYKNYIMKILSNGKAAFLFHNIPVILFFKRGPERPKRTVATEMILPVGF
jgi:hypothetical protein